MSVNGVSIAGTSPPVRSTQLLQGLIPTLVHGAPRRVLQIGIGTGETSRVVLEAGAERVTCVEISPEVVRATLEYFGPLSRGVFEDPRYSLVYADAKNYLRHTRERFDLVLSDSTYPFLSGSSGLYTLDYFRDCRARLAPGGIASAWLPLDLPRSGLRSLLGTFAEAFPHATLWTTSGYAYKHALLLGSAEPIRVRYGHVAKVVKQGGPGRHDPRIPRAALWAPLLGCMGVSSVEEFAARLLLDRDGMLRCAGGAPLHTDDRPVLEYETALRAANLWRERLAENMAELNGARASVTEHVDLSGMTEARRAEITRALVAAGRRASETTDALVRRLRLEARAFPYISGARRALRRGRREEAVGLYRRGLELHPGDERARVELRNLLLEMGRRREALELERAATSRGGARPDPPDSPREP
jgi:spermidine synthase